MYYDIIFAKAKSTIPDIPFIWLLKVKKKHTGLLCMLCLMQYIYKDNSHRHSTLTVYYTTADTYIAFGIMNT